MRLWNGLFGVAVLSLLSVGCGGVPTEATSSTDEAIDVAQRHRGTGHGRVTGTSPFDFGARDVQVVAGLHPPLAPNAGTTLSLYFLNGPALPIQSACDFARGIRQVDGAEMVSIEVTSGAPDFARGTAVTEGAADAVYQSATTSSGSYCGSSADGFGSNSFSITLDKYDADRVRGVVDVLGPPGLGVSASFDSPVCKFATF
jgi:hypothetical protein